MFAKQMQNKDSKLFFASQEFSTWNMTAVITMDKVLNKHPYNVLKNIYNVNMLEKSG